MAVVWLAPHTPCRRWPLWGTLEKILGRSYQLPALALPAVMAARWFTRGPRPTVTRPDLETVA